MREETRRRLDRAILIQKLKWGAAAVVAVMVAIGAFYWENRDIAVVATLPVGGTVIHVGQPAGKLNAATAQASLQVDVRLDDARVVHLLAPRHRAPALGDHVTIADSLHGSGRHTFSWQ